MTLNTNYKIPDKTLNTLCTAIIKLGFEDAFEIALEKSLNNITDDGQVILITEYLSWGHNLAKQAAVSENQDLRQKYSEAAIFYRKLAHHVYWRARELGLVEHNAYFIQAVE